MPDGQSATLEQELGELLDQERFEPPEDFARAALIGDLSEHEAAAKDSQDWWAQQARALHWFTDFEEVLDDSDPPFYKWFKDGKLNASYNCLDRHLKTQPDKVAIVFEADDGKVTNITYKALYHEVCRFANGLKNLGIRTGDRVIVYMPLVPEGIITMLACAGQNLTSTTRGRSNGIR